MQTWEELTVTKALEQIRNPGDVRQQQYPLSSEKLLASMQLIFGEVSPDRITEPLPVMSNKVEDTCRRSWFPPS